MCAAFQDSMDAEPQESFQLDYLKKIFDSIRKNAATLPSNDAELKRLVKRANEFYLSLFASKRQGTKPISIRWRKHIHEE